MRYPWAIWVPSSSYPSQYRTNIIMLIHNVETFMAATIA